MISKTKLKKYRLIRGYTQQALSEASGISIRTIQRIEKGISEGSPYTLKSLSKALEVEHSEIATLIDDSSLAFNESALNESGFNNNSFNESGLDNSNDLNDLKLLNLSAISLLIFPFGNLILPFILFLLGKRKNKASHPLSNKILSYQIIWSLITLAAMVLLPLIFEGLFDVLRGGGIPLFIPVYYLAGTVNILIIIQTAIRLNQEKEILDFAPNLL